MIFMGFELKEGVLNGVKGIVIEGRGRKTVAQNYEIAKDWIRMILRKEKTDGQQDLQR